MGFATRRLIISAVKIPNAMPITPTKTASHAAFVAGDRGAKTNNKSDAIGAFVAKENRKQSPLAGEFHQEK